jgi:hypothetical protein
MGKGGFNGPSTGRQSALEGDPIAPVDLHRATAFFQHPVIKAPARYPRMMVTNRLRKV